MRQAIRSAAHTLGYNIKDRSITLGTVGLQTPLTAPAPTPPVAASNVIGLNTTAGIEVTATGSGKSSKNLIQGNFIGTEPIGAATTGQSLPGYDNVTVGYEVSNNVGVLIDGTADASGNTVGGTIDTSTSGTTTLSGNVIGFNQNAGVSIGGSAAGNQLAGNYVGTDPFGLALGNAVGVVVGNSSRTTMPAANTIGGTASNGMPSPGNVISANRGQGLLIQYSDGNFVWGNTIGTGGSLAATSLSGNQGGGIELRESYGNQIGDKPKTSTSILADEVVAQLGGRANDILGNGGNGVLVTMTAAANATAGNSIIGNQISANSFNGVQVTGDLTGKSLPLPDISYNFIGTNADGTSAHDRSDHPLGNGQSGVLLEQTAVQGPAGDWMALVQGNVISGNGLSGVTVQSGDLGKDAPANVVIRDNIIGLDAAGKNAVFFAAATNAVLPLGNVLDGVLIDNVVGVTVGIPSGNLGTKVPAKPSNLISGNLGRGIEIRGNRFTSLPQVANTIQGNFIGTDAGGVLGASTPVGSTSSFTLGNLSDGVFLFVPGPTSIQNNPISNNRAAGIHAATQQTASGSGNSSTNTGRLTIQDNVVGTTAAQPAAALGNGSDGLFIDHLNVNLAQPLAAIIIQGNVFSGNRADGVNILDSNAASIVGNWIGTDQSGTSNLGSASNGVFLNGSSQNTIGGTADAAHNVISGNLASGVFISGSPGNAASGNLVTGNYIGTNGQGQASLPNEVSGVVISGGVQNTIGGARGTDSAGATTLGGGNIISGNRLYGVLIANGGTGNVLEGNLIGTNLSGATTIGNTSDGVFLINVTQNTVGGTSMSTGGNACRNIISGNAANGVRIFGEGATANQVANNFIGVGLDGKTAIGNLGNGVLLDNAGAANTIGGVSVAVLSNTIGPGNVISGNIQSGVQMLSTNTVTSVARTGAYIIGNKIGTDVSGRKAVPNHGNGIFVFGSSGNVIGGATLQAGLSPGNVISGNAQSGVFLFSPNAQALADNNLVLGNLIGTDGSGGNPLPNNANGVQILNASHNIIGGTNSNARNVISGNLANGVVIDALLGPGLNSTGNAIEGNFIGTNLKGDGALSNHQDGVLVNNAVNNTIGGTTSGALISRGGVSTNVPISPSNVISANFQAGIEFTGAAGGNSVLGNFIGVASDGVVRDGLGNSLGVFINNAGYSATPPLSNGDIVNIGQLIGSQAPGAGNIIAESRSLIGTPQSAVSAIGVEILGPQDLHVLASNRVQGNLIGIDGQENAAADSLGVYINNSRSNTIGGQDPAARNIISGNSTAGIEITGQLSRQNLVEGNFIGTNIAGDGRPGEPDTPTPNPSIPTAQTDGVLILNASSNQVGGPMAGMGNVISGNRNGVDVVGQSSARSSSASMSYKAT